MSLPPAFLSRFGDILTGLCDVLAARAALAHNPALLMLVLRWVQRLKERADVLAGRLANGEVLGPKKPRPAAKRAEISPQDAAGHSPEPDPKPPGPRLPLQWGWIVLQDAEALPFGTDLLALLLRDQAIRDFLEAAPEIVPSVRHLLRLLAIVPPDFLAAHQTAGSARDGVDDGVDDGPRRARVHAPRPRTGGSFFSRPLTLNTLNRPWKPV